MYRPRIDILDPISAWEHLVSSYVYRVKWRVRARHRMRRTRHRVRETKLFYKSKDALQLRFERVLAGQEEWSAVGVSSSELCDHLASKFTGAMAWQNQNVLWHVSFLLT